MKHIILITWKNGKKEVFPTLTKFLIEHSVASIATINNYISRKKIPYECDECTVEKLQINRK